MARVKGPSRERQEVIARELGLLPALEPVSRTRKTYPVVVKKVVPLPVAEPCPCKERGITEGREKIAGGWCVDGRFWSHAALARMRQMRAFMKDPEKNMPIMKRAIEIAIDHLGFDMDQSQLYLNVCEHTTFFSRRP